MKQEQFIIQPEIDSNEQLKAAEYLSKYNSSSKLILYVVLGYIGLILFGIVAGQITISNFSLVEIITKVIVLIVIFTIFGIVFIPSTIYSLLTGGETVIDHFFGIYNLKITDTFIYYFETMSLFAILLQSIVAIIYFIRFSTIYKTTFVKLIPFIIITFFILSLASAKTIFLIQIENISFFNWLGLQSLGIIFFALLHILFSILKNSQDDLSVLNKVFGFNKIMIVVIIFSTIISGLYLLLTNTYISITVSSYLYNYVTGLVYVSLFLIILNFFYESWKITTYAESDSMNLLSIIILMEIILVTIGLIIVGIMNNHPGIFIINSFLLLLLSIFALTYRNFLSFFNRSGNKDSILASINLPLISTFILFVLIPIFVPFLENAFNEISSIRTVMHNTITGEIIWWIPIIGIVTLFTPAAPLGLLILGVIAIQYAFSIGLLLIKFFIVLLILIAISYATALLIINLMNYLKHLNILKQFLIAMVIGTLAIIPVYNSKLESVYISNATLYNPDKMNLPNIYSKEINNKIYDSKYHKYSKESGYSWTLVQEIKTMLNF